MPQKPNYDELELRVKQLERSALEHQKTMVSQNRRTVIKYLSFHQKEN